MYVYKLFILSLLLICSYKYYILFIKKIFPICIESKNKFNSDRNNSCKNETSDMSDTSDEETSELTDNISGKEESMYRLSNTVNTVT